MTNRVCPACGTWKCATCGWERSRASRFIEGKPQDCGKCGSTDGVMRPIRHHPYIYANHVEDMVKNLLPKRQPQYPLEGYDYGFVVTPVSDSPLVLICRGCDECFHSMIAAQEHGVYIPGSDPSWCGEAGFDLAPEEML